MKNNLSFFIIGLFTCTILCVLTLAVNAECNDLNIEINEQNRELTYNRNELTNLETKITMLSRREKIQEIAREKLNLVVAILEPEEIILKD